MSAKHQYQINRQSTTAPRVVLGLRLTEEALKALQRGESAVLISEQVNDFVDKIRCFLFILHAIMLG
jgi:hypothetical protein